MTLAVMSFKHLKEVLGEYSELLSKCDALEKEATCTESRISVLKKLIELYVEQEFKR